IGSPRATASRDGPTSLIAEQDAGQPAPVALTGCRGGWTARALSWELSTRSGADEPRAGGLPGPYRLREPDRLVRRSVCSRPEFRVSIRRDRGDRNRRAAT